MASLRWVVNYAGIFLNVLILFLWGKHFIWATISIAVNDFQAPCGYCTLLILCFNFLLNPLILTTFPLLKSKVVVSDFEGKFLLAQMLNVIVLRWLFSVSTTFISCTRPQAPLRIKFRAVTTVVNSVTYHIMNTPCDWEMHSSDDDQDDPRGSGDVQHLWTVPLQTKSPWILRPQSKGLPWRLSPRQSRHHARM